MVFTPLIGYALLVLLIMSMAGGGAVALLFALWFMVKIWKPKL
jgi:hypothetical protein